MIALLLGGWSILLNGVIICKQSGDAQPSRWADWGMLFGAVNIVVGVALLAAAVAQLISGGGQ